MQLGHDIPHHHRTYDERTATDDYTWWYYDDDPCDGVNCGGTKYYIFTHDQLADFIDRTVLQPAARDDITIDHNGRQYYVDCLFDDPSGA